MAKITGTGLNQGDLVKLLKALRNRVFGTPGLAVGSTTTRIQTATAVTFMIDGVVYAKAATDPVEAAGTGINTGASETRKVRIEINSSGVVSYIYGAAATAQALAKIPPRSASKATLGYVEIPASFTQGTTLYSATGVAFVNGDPDLDASMLEA